MATQQELADLQANNPDQYADLSARVEQALVKHAHFILTSMTSPSAEQTAWAESLLSSTREQQRQKDLATRWVIMHHAGQNTAFILGADGPDVDTPINDANLGYVANIGVTQFA